MDFERMEFERIELKRTSPNHYSGKMADLPKGRTIRLVITESHHVAAILEDNNLEYRLVHNYNNGNIISVRVNYSDGQINVQNYRDHGLMEVHIHYECEQSSKHWRALQSISKA